MKLLEHLPFQAEINPAAPAKIDLSGMLAPQDVEITFIGVSHHDDIGSPDYLRDIFAKNDVLINEAFGWSKPYARQIQQLANGSYRDREAVLGNLQLRQQQDMSERGMRRGQAIWDESYFRALYKSKVKVIMPDYPVNSYPVTSGTYEKSLRRFSKAIVDKAEVADYDLVQLSKRDAFIGRSICSSVAALRMNDSKIRSKSKLNIVMPYGAKHLGVIDALDELATQQDTTEYSSNSFFEEPSYSSFLSLDDQLEIARIYREHIVRYQNWLREVE